MVSIMRLSTLLLALGLVTQALSISHSCEKDVEDMSLAESDAAVAEYFAKLEPATQWTLFHEMTGPEAGADVRYRLPTGPPRGVAFCFSFVLIRSICLSSGWCNFSDHPRS